jgi:hypothetical protein
LPVTGTRSDRRFDNLSAVRILPPEGSLDLRVEYLYRPPLSHANQSIPATQAWRFAVGEIS